MTKDFYIWINGVLHERRDLSAIVVFLDRMITITVFCAYPLLLVFLLWDGVREPRFLIVPASGFLLLSLIRSRLGVKRPYEELPITPLVDKKTKAKSLPSRHVFSAFMISITFLAAAFYYPSGDLRRHILLGIAVVMILLSDILGDMRIFMGVHYLRDTLCGMAAALLWGILYIFI